MTTNSIGGFTPNFSTSGTERVKGTDSVTEEKVAGHRPPPPPPPPKSEDTYTVSEEGAAALAEMQAAAEEASESADSSDAVDSEQSSGNQIDAETVAALKAELKQNQGDFLQKMVGILTGQSNAALQGTGIWQQISLGDFTVTPEQQAEAAEAISEDGYWGVEQTANRIVDMAKALVGSDPDKADEMMAAIEKGFEAAEKAWGGELPSITSDTKDRIDELFAEWKEQSGTSAVTG